MFVRACLCGERAALDVFVFAGEEGGRGLWGRVRGGGSGALNVFTSVRAG